MDKNKKFTLYMSKFKRYLTRAAAPVSAAVAGLSLFVSRAGAQVSDPLEVATTTQEIVTTGKYYLNIAIDTLWPVFLGALLIVLGLTVVIWLFMKASGKLGGGGGR